MKQHTRGLLSDIATAIVIAGLVFLLLFSLGYAVVPIVGVFMLLATGVLMIRVALRRAPSREALVEAE